MSHAPSPRPSWKQSNQRSSSGPSIRTGRWFFGLLSLALLGAFGWIIYAIVIYREPQIQLVTMVAGEYGKLAVPSTPFANHDLALIRQAQEEGRARHLQLHDWSSLLESGRFEQFSQQLSDLSFGQRDSLVLYISAHGLSFPDETGSADLIGRDFDLRQPDRARLPLQEILQALSKCSASQKILVLDTGHLLSDPRLGVLANGFPAAASRSIETHQQADPNLCVVFTSSPLETVSWLPQAPGTVFGRHFVQGLLGQADVTDEGKAGDARLTLDELIRYVHHGCRQSTATNQTPLFLAPESLDPSRWMLAILSPPEAAQDTPSASETPAAPAASAADPATKPDAAKASGETAATSSAAPPTESDEKVAAKAETATAAASPNASASNAPSTPTNPSAGTAPAASTTQTADASVPPGTPGASSADTLRSLLDQAWILRDNLESLPIAANQWAPQEYAPHFWRELNAHLLEFEIRERAGQNDTDIAKLVLQSLKNLERFSHGEAIDPPEHRELFVDHVLLAAHQFRNHDRYRLFESQSTGALAKLAAAIREVERDAYPLPDYLQWFAVASKTPTADRSLDQELNLQLRTFLDHLVAFRKEVQALANQPLPPGAEEQILDLQANVRQAARAVRGEIDQRLEDALGRPTEPASQRELLLLWQSPLLSHPQRQQVASVLRKLPPLSAPADLRPISPAPASVLREVATLQQQKWNLLWQLEMALIAANDERSSLTSQASPFEKATDFWMANQQAGTALRAYFEGLPERCKSSATDTLESPAHSDQSTDVSRLVQLVDPRDVMTSELYAAGFPLFDLKPPRVQPVLTAAWQPGASLPLQMDRPTDVILRLTRTDTVDKRVQWELRFPEEAIEVSHDGKVLRAGIAPALELKELTLDVPLKVRAKEQVLAGNESIDRVLFVRFRAGAVSTESRLTCQLPRPNEVRLIARDEQSDAVNGLGSEAVELHTFANRITTIPLALQNLSGVARSVQVQVYALPAVPDAEWPPGRVVQANDQPADRIVSSIWDTARNRIKPGATMIASTPGALVLPADGKPVDLILADARPATPAAAPPADGANGAAPVPPPTATPKTDISQGLLCVITDVPDATGTAANRSPQVWRRWIQLTPRPPRDFFDAEAAYDLAQAAIELQPKPDVDLPVVSKETPFSVVWRGAQRENLATRTLEQFGPVSLRVPLRKSTTPTEIALDVDGYPRAFHFQLPLDYQSRAEPLEANARDPVVIEQVSDGSRLFLREGISDQVTLPPEDKRERIVLVGEDAVAAVPVSGQPKDLLLQFRCDAPVTSFGSDDANDRIEITLRDQNDDPAAAPISLYADRQVSFQLAPFGPQGELAIETRVADFQQPLRLTGAEGEFELSATMILNGETHEEDSIRLICDAHPPEILRARVLNRTVFIGDPVRVQLDVKDLSGLARVDYSFVKRPQDPLDDATKLTQSTRDNQAIIELPPPEIEGKKDLWIAMVLYDRAGNQLKTVHDTEFSPLKVTISPKPKAATEGPAGPFVGTITGRVKAGPRFFPDGIEIKLLKGTDPVDKTTSANDGHFKFSKIEAGVDYTLEASGRTPVGRFVGKKGLKLEKKEDYGELQLFELEKEKPKEGP